MYLPQNKTSFSQRQRNESHKARLKKKNVASTKEKEEESERRSFRN
tara:strand:+ start:184 stop:321 length:138 start_codon:yes stop_codon:yes gene_type:complete